jgi:hypothetical protein
MIEFDGTCGSCPLNWVDYKYSESTVCAVTRKDVEDADKCDCPTERRAALIAQLTQEDREALELGCRVRAMPRDVNLDDMGREWFAVKRGYSIGRGKTPLNALRNANIGNGWDEKGDSEE